MDGGAQDKVKLDYLPLLQLLGRELTGTRRYLFFRSRQNEQKQELAYLRAKKKSVSAAQVGYILDPAPDACK